jgi:hypothetical protein
MDRCDVPLPMLHAYRTYNAIFRVGTLPTKPKPSANMATQQDLQELLRLLTVSRKVPMIQAMGQIKALQAVGLKRCACISSTTLVSHSPP